MAFVVVKRRPVLGAGDRHGRAAPCGQHDQGGSLAQSVVQARQPIDSVDRSAEFRLEKQQYPLKNRARHVQRPDRASQRLAAGIVDHLGGDLPRQYQGFAELDGEVFDVGGKRRHLERLDGACRACGGNSRRSLAAGCRQDCAGSSTRSLALALKNIPLISAASFGCIDRLDAIRNCASLGGLTGGARRACTECSFGERHGLIGTGGPQPELSQDLDRRARIDRKPCPHRRARRVVDLIDQAGGEFDKLPRFVLAVHAGLNVEIGQHAQQGGSDIDALAARERHQSIKAGKQRRCGHVKGTRLSNSSRQPTSVALTAR